MRLDVMPVAEPNHVQSVFPCISEMMMRLDLGLATRASLTLELTRMHGVLYGLTSSLPVRMTSQGSPGRGIAGGTLLISMRCVIGAGADPLLFGTGTDQGR